MSKASAYQSGPGGFIMANIFTVVQILACASIPVLEGYLAHEKKDGSMVLVIMQIVAAAVAYAFPMKETVIFFICAVLVSMAKFFIIDIKVQ